MGFGLGLINLKLNPCFGTILAPQNTWSATLDGAAQLDAEVDSGAWVLTPALPEHVFEPRPNLWQKLMAWLTLERKIPWQSVPDDPTVN